MFKKIQQKTNMNPIGATIVKTKGRGKTPTSVLVFDLDEKSVEYVLGENKKRLVGSLYEKMKGGSKLIFISRVDSVLKRLQEAMPFKIETQLIKDRGLHKMKEEVMKIVLHNMTDKIKPQASTYIGTLFEKEATNSHTFKFGTVLSPSTYFSSLLLSKSTQSHEESVASTISPIKGDEEFHSAQKGSKLLDESFMELAPCHSFDVSLTVPEEIEHSFASNQKLPQLLNESFEHNNDNNNFSEEHDTILNVKSFDAKWEENVKQKNNEQDQLRKELPLLYTRIKDLNNRISGKLCHKLDQLKTKQTLPEFEKDIKSPISKSSLLKVFEPGSQLGKRMKNFEDDMFNEYLKDVETELKDVDDNIFNISNGMRSSTEMGLKIKNINFEVTNECDTRPIMKKLKRPDNNNNNKTGKENNEPSGSNQIILEYKTSIPGEKQTTLHVYGRDIQKLEPNCLLNDTIIQFYLKLVQSEFVDSSEKRKFYIFNTYLIEKLKANKPDKNMEEEIDFEKIYNNVKKWTKDVDIFEKDFLLFPMHDKGQKHWSLFIVCYPKYLLAKKEPDTNGTSGKAFILYFDSHGVMEPEIAKLIALYLQYEVMHKKPEIYNTIKTQFNSIEEGQFYQVIVPQQDNSTDCGLYLLEYAERFMTDRSQILENIQTNRIKLNLFPKCIFKSKRADIANIILELAKGHKEVLQEYQKTKKQKLEMAKDNPNEFLLIFSKEDIAEYLLNHLKMDINEFKAAEQDRIIAHCLPVLYEHLSSSSRS